MYNNRTHPRRGYAMATPRWRGARTPKEPTKLYEASRVFAAAVAAQELNGEYLKNPKLDPEDYTKVLAKPNKELMRELLDTAEFTEEQIQKGEQVMRHYQGLLFQQMAGELKDFLASALRVSSRETFGNTDWVDLAIVAALPSCYERDIVRQTAQDERAAAAAKSQPVGQRGERIQGEFQVVQCNFSPKWQSWTVNAIRDGNLYFFFFNAQLQPNQIVRLAGTVKCHRDGNVTQLNRVKVVK